MTLFEKIGEYLQYPFVQYAIIVGILISLCASILGVMLVLKRFSYIADGLSHTAFTAIAFSSIIGLIDNILIVLPITIIFAIIILCNNNKKIKSDALISVLSVSSMAIGYLLLSMFSNSNNIVGDVCSTLFGSTLILTLTKAEVIICIILSIIVLTAFILLYNKIFALSFDETFSKACGMNTLLYNVIISIIIAIIIVLAMNLVGTLLISALIIFPALASMRVCKSFKTVTIFSAIFSVVCAVVGLLFAIVLSAPVGPSIVLIDIIGFIICIIIGKIKK